MRTALATLLYRFRRPLSALIVLGALLLAPRASITRIDNDLTAWFSRDDPVYLEYQRFQDEFEIRFPLIHADAERVPLQDSSFDLAISEYGAALWCDPYRWIPEAARILRDLNPAAGG